MTPFDVYADLEVREVINAATQLTSLGGTVLIDEVVEAMVSASRSCVSMDELHDAAGRRLAILTRNEAAYVTSGCSTAIVLSVLAAITKGRPELIARLPYDESLPRKVVIHRAHRNPYDRSIEMAGGHLVEVGNVIETFGWELEAAIGDDTAAVFWVAGKFLPQTTLGLKETVEIAHARGVPVIVDAAGQLPPMENLWNFTVECGADLALFSGGKALRGPQASGIMVGSPELVAAARANGSPNMRFARSMKVGKEEICGLVAAIEHYVALDHAGIAKARDETVAMWVAGLEGLNGVQARHVELNHAGQPSPRMEITLEPGVAGLNAGDVSQRLWDATPRVAVMTDGDTHVYVTPDTLTSNSDAELVLKRLRAVLAS